MRFIDLLYSGKDKDVLDAVSKLYISGVSATERLSLPLRYATENGQIKTVKWLVENTDVKINADGGYAIGIASQHGNLEIVKYLLKQPKIIPHMDDNYALKNAIKKEHYDVARVLLAHPKVLKKYLDNSKKWESEKLEWVEMILNSKKVGKFARLLR